jgi:regulatory protein YycI of two-component signal transduction system YycFG
MRGETEQVTAAELGYRAELLAENYTALRPVWRVTTDRGVYTVDALTLAVND